MTITELGAIGEIIGGVAVVISLIYVAGQIRQSAHQLEQNSRQIQASMYHATNDAFYRWFVLIAQDPTLGGLWFRGLRGDPVPEEERPRFNALLSALFLAYENNFQQEKLGSVDRGTLEISSPIIKQVLAQPAARNWWNSQAPAMFTADFRQVINEISDGRSADRG